MYTFQWVSVSPCILYNRSHLDYVHLRFNLHRGIALYIPLLLTMPAGGCTCAHTPSGLEVVQRAFNEQPRRAAPHLSLPRYAAPRRICLFRAASHLSLARRSSFSGTAPAYHEKPGIEDRGLGSNSLDSVDDDAVAAMLLSDKVLQEIFYGLDSDVGTSGHGASAACRGMNIRRGYDEAIRRMGDYFSLDCQPLHYTEAR